MKKPIIKVKELYELIGMMDVVGKVRVAYKKGKKKKLKNLHITRSYCECCGNICYITDSEGKLLC